jgi:hypothetical protein
MIIRKADEQTEAGVLPTEQQISEMMAYNTQLVEAGIMLAGEGLHPTSNASRITFRDGESTIVDGPFAEAKELIAGFTMIEVKDRQEALEWVRRWPEPNVELELRQVFSADDFGDAATPELRELESRLREQVPGAHATS